MSINQPKADASSSLNHDFDLGSFIAAAKTVAARKRTSRAAKSGVAGSALVAAMIGAQFAEEAVAADQRREGEDLYWLRNVRICGGHLVVNEAAATSHADHSANQELGSSALFSNHGAHFSADSLSADVSGTRASFADIETRRTERFADERHAEGHQRPVGGRRGADDANDDGVIDSDLGGHTHEEPSTGGTTDGATSGATDGSTSGTTDGHTHTDGPTGATSGGVPHTDDPAKQKEHLALMNLVPASAATHVAVNDGSWFDPKTWANGQVPGDGAKVLIPQGVTVDYDGKSAASVFTVRVDGELDFATDVDTFMEVDTFVVAPTGTLTIGTESRPVDPNVTATISFADNGPINVAWDPMLLSRGLISHGTVDIHGAEKDAFLKVAVDPMKGDTKMTLEGPPDGWQVGDKIVLAGTHLVASQSGGKDTPVTSQTQDEELVITAINGNVITFDKPLQYDHEGARADLKTYVANYSRNVVFESEGGASTPVHERGHVMLMHSDNITVKYAQFEELGRTDKSQRSFDIGQLTDVDSDFKHPGTLLAAHPSRRRRRSRAPRDRRRQRRVGIPGLGVCPPRFKRDLLEQRRL